MGPSFIVIGAMKCGTSTVCAYLEDHPSLFMVPGCEPNFFSHNDNFARGQEWYEKHFEQACGKPCGEGSNDYANSARYPDAAARMARLYPDVKLIYMVRHPLDRIRSAWIQRRADGGDAVPATLDRAVTEEPQVFVDQSLYWKNISLYRQFYPDAQIFIGFLEDLASAREAFFTELANFLGVKPLSRIARGHQNPSAGKAVPLPMYTKVNRLPLMFAAKRVLPPSVKKLVKDRFLSARIEEPPNFSAKVRQRVVALVQEDAENFLAFAGRSTTFWNFDK